MSLHWLRCLHGCVHYLKSQLMSAEMSVWGRARELLYWSRSPCEKRRGVDEDLPPLPSTSLVCQKLKNNWDRRKVSVGYSRPRLIPTYMSPITFLSVRLQVRLAGTPWQDFHLRLSHCVSHNSVLNFGPSNWFDWWRSSHACGYIVRIKLSRNPPFRMKPQGFYTTTLETGGARSNHW